MGGGGTIFRNKAESVKIDMICMKNVLTLCWTIDPVRFTNTETKSTEWREKEIRHNICKGGEGEGDYVNRDTRAQHRLTRYISDPVEKKNLFFFKLDIVVKRSDFRQNWGSKGAIKEWQMFNDRSVPPLLSVTKWIHSPDRRFLTWLLYLSMEISK